MPGLHAENAEEQEHVARHGGYFGDADDIYHYEVLVDPAGRVILYVNDEYNKPLDVSTLRGRLTLCPDDPTPFVGWFTPADGGAYFEARLTAIAASPIHLLVEVEKDGEWAPMEFTIPVEPVESL